MRRCTILHDTLSPYRLGSQDFAGLAGSGGQQRGLDRRAGHRCKNFAMDAVLVGSQLEGDRGGQEERRGEECIGRGSPDMEP